MKKIRRVLGLIVVVALVLTVSQATAAFFSDTETSTDNRFQAGTIDLTVGDSNSFYSAGDATAEWDLTDLTDEVFFYYLDVKPGDYGYDTINLEVNDNDAYMCANVTITKDGENGVQEPEAEAGDFAISPGFGYYGELADYMSFVFWEDEDNDGLFEPLDGEKLLTGGHISDVFDGSFDPAAPDLSLASETYTLIDSLESNLEGGDEVLDTVVEPGKTYNLGKYWCFGEVSYDSEGVFTCDGNGDYNDAQSDRVYGNLSFYAVQSRNNSGFECSSWNPNTL